MEIVLFHFIVLTIIGSIGLSLCLTYGVESKQNEAMSRLASYWAILTVIAVILHLCKVI